MAVGRRLMSAVGLGAIAYAWWLRPRMLRWGATDEEVFGPYPGRDLVPDSVRTGTMAVTIDAPPAEVWPWLVQLGSDRGGWYSWDLLDNAGRPSATEVHPEWQDLPIGTQLRYCLPGAGTKDAYRVAVVEPDRFLGLHGLSDLRGRLLEPEDPRPAAYMEGLWGFELRQLQGDRTRLVISGWQAIRPRWVDRYVMYWFFPVVWIMQARMMAVLKRNIERVRKRQIIAAMAAA